MDLISPVLLGGMKVTFIPAFMIPVSTRPTGTVPTPLMEYTSLIGTRNGLSVGFGGSATLSSASRRHGPSYQGVSSGVLTFRLAASSAEVGMKGTVPFL